MNRLDGSRKSETGFLGRLSDLRNLVRNPPKVMTESSIGVPGTNEMFRPALVPTLTQDEILQVRLGNITPEIQRKSLEHALMRERLGRPVFFEDSEIPELQGADEFIRTGITPDRFNPLVTGTITPLPETRMMKMGRAFQNYLNVLRKTFPSGNPYGQALEDFFLGGSEDLADRMAMGDRRAIVDTRPNTPTINPVVPEAASLLPIATAVNVATKTAPLATGLIAAKSATEGLKEALEVPDQVNSQDLIGDALVQARLATDPASNVMMSASKFTEFQPNEIRLITREDGRKLLPNDPDRFGFRSTVADVLNLDTFPNSGTAQQMLAELGQKGGLGKRATDAVGQRNINKEELKFLGVTELLEAADKNNKRVTRDDLLNTVSRNRYKYNLEEEVRLEVDPTFELIEEKIPIEKATFRTPYGEGLDDRIEMELNEGVFPKLYGLPDDTPPDELRDAIEDFYIKEYEKIPEEKISLDIDSSFITGSLLFNDSLPKNSKLYAYKNFDSEFGDGYWEIRIGDDVNYEVLDKDGQFGNPNSEDYEFTQRTIPNRQEAIVQLKTIGAEITGTKRAEFKQNTVDFDVVGLSNPENYREIIVRLPYETPGSIRGHFGNDVAYHARVSDREILIPNNVLSKDFYKNETLSAKDATVEDRLEFLSVFMSDESPQRQRHYKDILDNGSYTRVLFVDEIQSDYAQAVTGGKLKGQLKRNEKLILKLLDLSPQEVNKGLRRLDIPENHEAHKKLIREIKSFKNKYEQREEALGKEIDNAIDKRYDLENTPIDGFLRDDDFYSELRQITDEVEALKETQVKAMGYKVNAQGLLNKLQPPLNPGAIMADGALVDSRSYVKLKDQPLIGSDQWVDHAIKNLITKMVNEDYPSMVFSSGKNQSEMWGNKKLQEFYDRDILKAVKKILKGIDPDAVKTINLRALDSDDIYDNIRQGGDNQHIIIENTDKIKDFIKNIGESPKKGFNVSAVAPVIGSGLLATPEASQRNNNINAGLLA